MRNVRLAYATALGLATALTLAQAQSRLPVPIDADDIGGVVSGPKGPEAGAWGIAETTGLPTKFAKIVVSDERGRYVVTPGRSGFRWLVPACRCTEGSSASGTGARPSRTGPTASPQERILLKRPRGRAASNALSSSHSGIGRHRPAAVAMPSPRAITT